MDLSKYQFDNVYLRHILLDASFVRTSKNKFEGGVNITSLFAQYSKMKVCL